MTEGETEGTQTQEARRNKRQEQARESRQRLLDTALTLFASQGYAVTSAHLICQQSGVADSLLYHYFPGGKAEIVQKLLEEQLNGLIDELNFKNKLLETLPLAEALEVLYMQIEVAVSHHADALRLVCQERDVRSLIDTAPMLEVLRSRWRWFPMFLRHRARRGEIRRMDYVRAAEMVDSYCLLQLMTELLGLSKNPLKDPAYRKKMIDYQLDLWEYSPKKTSTGNDHE